MNLFRIFLISVALSILCFPQDNVKIALIGEKDFELIEAVNQTGTYYISLPKLLNKLNINHDFEIETNAYKLKFKDASIFISLNNPFVKIVDPYDSLISTIQLTTLPFQKSNEIYIALSPIIQLINIYWNKELVQLAANRIKIIEKTKQPDFSKSNRAKILNVTLESGEDNILFRIKTNLPINNYYHFYREQKLHLILWDTEISKDSILIGSNGKIIESVQVNRANDYIEFIFQVLEKNTVTETFKGLDDNELILRIAKRDYGDWYVRESKNFKVIFRDSHAHLVTHILASAENSLNLLGKLFNYVPKEKIIINTYDVNDYGFGATTTIPENYIRLEIEPLEPGYEVVPYSERFQWLLSHELVHIVVNDMANNFESSSRKIFGKVAPDKNQPLSVFYSLLTNHNRYTPRWYQEAIAVFMETWLSGGYGRILGNFDEMYFRSMINEKIDFPSPAELEEYTTHTSIFLENLSYTYGARFVAYLTNKYSVQKLLDWFSQGANEFYPGIEGKFYEIYGVEFSYAWEDFINEEKNFQQMNINLLKKYPLTEVSTLSDEAFGWVTKPVIDSGDKEIYWGYHNAGKLAEIQKFSLGDLKSSDVATLNSPSMIQVASLTYDENYKHLFYTTNNNQLYRDLWQIDLNSNKHRMLFEDSRVGHLTISPEKHELWGIQHISAKTVLVKTKYPYTELKSLYVFNVGDEFQDLSINRKGNLLAATLHRSNGQQSIILSDISRIEEGKSFTYRVITSSGSPENPSWSLDGKYIYWNAYTNGVSNIYRYDIITEEIIPLTHTIQGLFRPLEISTDTLFAMQFTIDGFIPVKFKIKKNDYLPAINYYGQNILEKSNEILTWNLKRADDVIDKATFTSEVLYSGLSSLSIQTFIPVVSGFQKRVVLGIYSQISDPLLNHDFIIDAGISPFKESSDDVKTHLRLKYSYKQKLIISFEHNGQDFYDLFNTRKRGLLGSRFAFGYTNFWKYDNPLKIKQNTELSVYRGIKFINDNLTEVTQPDFATLKSELEIRNLRRTIGSIDWESGDLIKLSALLYGSDFNKTKYSGQVMGEWDKYVLAFISHNVLHLKIATGYHFVNEDLPETMFFFGGFGNREIENEPVKQFEKMFRFPGVPIYSITADKFVKVMLENSLPPIRFPGASLGTIDLKNINISLFSQALYSDSYTIDKAISVGTQLNIMFQHWNNLESTISTGFAKAWWNGGDDFEWFISFKLLKD